MNYTITNQSEIQESLAMPPPKSTKIKHSVQSGKSNSISLQSHGTVYFTSDEADMDQSSCHKQTRPNKTELNFDHSVVDTTISHETIAPQRRETIFFDQDQAAMDVSGCEDFKTTNTQKSAYIQMMERQHLIQSNEEAAPQRRGTIHFNQDQAAMDESRCEDIGATNTQKLPTSFNNDNNCENNDQQLNFNRKHSKKSLPIILFSVREKTPMDWPLQAQKH